MKTIITDIEGNKYTKEQWRRAKISATKRFIKKTPKMLLGCHQQMLP